MYKFEEDYDYVRVKNWLEYIVEGMEVFNFKVLKEIDKYSVLFYERENFFCVVERKFLKINMVFI